MELTASKYAGGALLVPVKIDVVIFFLLVSEVISGHARLYFLIGPPKKESKLACSL
jgi:hypothetical protein